MSNTSRVYIGQLSYEIRENDVEDFFKGYGKIRDINLKQGYGFVEFDDYRDANDAVHDLNGKHMLGDHARLKDFVASQVDGEIVSSNAHKEKREALFEFRRSSEAESAIKKLDGTKFDGEYITVEDARASYVGDKSSRSRSSSSEDNGRRSESPARRQASLSDGDD
uniref:RRM domain-containing protein n=1 Tax=Trichuris muris TaxID=70415 RepID=A0A5S6Q0F1_TRIMR